MKRKSILMIVMCLLAIVGMVNAQTRDLKKQVSSVPRPQLQLEAAGQLNSIQNFQPGVTYHRAVTNTRDNVIYSNGFDSQDELSDLGVYDYNDDDFTWGWYNSIGVDGSYALGNQSYDFDNQTAITPDDFIIMPSITLSGAASNEHYFLNVYAEAYYANQYGTSETFGIFVAPEDDEYFYQVGSDFVISTGEYELCEVDLNDFAGLTVEIYIRHYNCSDGTYLFIDNYSVFTREFTAVPVQSITASDLSLMEGFTAQIDYTVLPADANSAISFTSANTAVATVDANGKVTAVAAGTTTITISADADGVSTTINVTVEPLPVGLTFDFETDPEEEGWVFVDSDNDGFNWVWIDEYDGAFHGAGCLISQSYSNYDTLALTPDNWAVSPAILIKNSSSTMNILAKGVDANYAAEHFQFYVGTTADISSMTAVSSEFVATGSYALYTANLSAYAGQTVYLAIRHYNVTDQFILAVDYMVVTNAELAPEGTPVTSITADDVTVAVGETFTITPTVLPADATDPSVTYTSTDETIATVDENGVVTGVSVGTTTIAIFSVSNPDVKATINVTVTAAADPVQFTVVAPATAHPGDVITVEAYLTAPDEGYTGFTGLALGIHFNTAAFAVYGNPIAGPVVTASQMSMSALPNDSHPDEVQYSLVMTPGNPNTTTGLVFSMQFTVLEEVELGSYTFYAEPTSANNFVYNSGGTIGTPISYETTPSTVEITDAPTTVTQTVALVSGTNWVSFYVETDLDALKAALVAAISSPRNTKISSQDASITCYSATTWRGDLEALDLSKSYRITVPVGCEITLEGELVDPAEHPVTIKKGANWIGYPLTESMTPAAAFTGFAVRNDKVSSQAASSTCYGTTWRGDLSSLVPGQGYIYNSTVDGEKTFTFPASASKTRKK